MVIISSCTLLAHLTLFTLLTLLTYFALLTCFTLLQWFTLSLSYPRFLQTGLRRGVRSYAQMSCTETRFQKCSQSGRNGSKHPMLSISMAYNVISCKKTKETLKKSKSLILQCKFGSRAQKSKHLKGLL